MVDDDLLRIEDGRDVNAMQTIPLSILELGLRCYAKLPNERLVITWWPRLTKSNWHFLETEIAASNSEISVIVEVYC